MAALEGVVVVVAASRARTLSAFRQWLAVVALALLGTAAAADAAADRNEVNGLLGSIEQSSCRFMRNGSGYSGREAAEHLRAKWRVAEKRAQDALTAEQFIAQVASASSMSGRPYEVVCGSEGERALSEWLKDRLRALRAAAEPHS